MYCLGVVDEDEVARRENFLFSTFKEHQAEFIKIHQSAIHPESHPAKGVIARFEDDISKLCQENNNVGAYNNNMPALFRVVLLFEIGS